MEHDDEAYVFQEECITSLNYAWLIIEELQKTQTPPIITWAAYRMALVEYSKPFRTSYGEERKRRYRMDALPLSEEDLVLHKRVTDLRDQYLAHTDIGVKGAKVYPGENGAPRITIMNLDPAPPEMAEVRGLIERSLLHLYAQHP